MTGSAVCLRAALGALSLLLITAAASGQDLDPRAYARVPVDMTVVVAGFGYTYGSVVTDPAMPIQDLKAKIETPLIGIGHTFSLFGLTSQAFASLPYSWAQASGLVLGADSSTTRSGFSDMKFRFSVLLLGAPAATVEEFAKVPREPVLGASLTVAAPTGQFFSNKVINLGANRWSFKPELGVSYPFGKRWLIDFYTGVWLFTNNNSFYPGTSVRSQNPLISLQAHLSYNIDPLTWAAIDLTYYSGGQSSVNETYKDDRQNNSRIGATLNLPVGRQHSVKIAFSTGTIVRFGANFTTVSVAWQTALF